MLAMSPLYNCQFVLIELIQQQGNLLALQIDNLYFTVNNWLDALFTLSDEQKNGYIYLSYLTHVVRLPTLHAAHIIVYVI